MPNCTRDEKVLRGRQSGVDLKPPQAAVVKSNGGERCGKIGTRFRQARLREASASEPLQKCQKRIAVEVNVSPSETAIGGSHRKKVIRRGLCWILDSADEIAMLPGWEVLKGACADKATAEAIGLPVRYLKQYEKLMLVYQLCTDFQDK